MFNQDREEQFDKELNITEYLASFINYDAVIQTKEARATKKVVPDEDFGQILRDKFGRDLSPEMLANAQPATDDAPEKPAPVKKKGSISVADIRKYTGIKLDDVKFIPNKKK
jgi:hypothetical protein